MKDTIENILDNAVSDIEFCEKSVSIEEKIHIEISEDEMEAYLTINALKDELITFDEIMEEVRSKVKYGIDEENIKYLLKYKIYYQKSCIARGKQPVEGKNGEIKYYFDMREDPKPKINVDGSVDFKELGLISNVKKGDLIAEIILPIEGRDGMTVTGEVIHHKKGKKPQIKIGKNIIISEDQRHLISAENGLIYFKNNELDVKRVYSVDKVDNSTGNIDFNGIVKINNNVLTGFKVKAEEDILVGGVVEGAYIKSGKNIKVCKGIVGHDQGNVEGNGKLDVGYIENANIYCGDSVIADYILHSNIISKNSIIAQGRKGTITGGHYIAGQQLFCNVLGSVMNAKTIVEVGVNPEIKRKIQNIEKEIEIIKVKLKKVEECISLIDKIRLKTKLNCKENEIHIKVINTQAILLESLDEKKEELIRIEKIRKVSSNARVLVKDIIYPGVKIKFGDNFISIKEELENCVIHNVGNKIKINSL